MVLDTYFCSFLTLAFGDTPVVHCKKQNKNIRPTVDAKMISFAAEEDLAEEFILKECKSEPEKSSLGVSHGNLPGCL